MFEQSNTEQFDVRNPVNTQERLIQLNSIYLTIMDLMKELQNVKTDVGRTIMMNAMATGLQQLGSLIDDVKYGASKLQEQLDNIHNISDKSLDDFSDMKFIDNV